jgi:molybdopterin-guanine dinucleotide biosynthesis protein A
LKTAIILAGGKSSRLGKDKALLNLRGKPLIIYVINVALEVVDKVIVVVKDKEEVYKNLLPKNITIVKDIFNIQSPLVGMLTGMKMASTDYSLVLPCDSPFINTDLLKHLFKCANGFDAAIPKWPSGYIEPLHSVYKVNTIIPLIEDALKKEELKISNVISKLKNVIYVPIEELKKYDSKFLSFFNINKLEDLKAAEIIFNPFIASFPIKKTKSK